MDKSELIKLIDEIIERALPKNKWVTATSNDLKTYSHDIYDMIHKSYEYTGGYPTIRSSNDINTSDIKWWKLIDVDQYPDPDAVIAGKLTPYGKKLTLSACDGSHESTMSMMYDLKAKLNSPGYYSEVSGKTLQLAEHFKVPIVNNKERVEQILGKPIKWLNDNGYYERVIDGILRKKKLVGRPN